MKKSTSRGITKRNVLTGVHGRFSILNDISLRNGEAELFMFLCFTLCYVLCYNFFSQTQTLLKQKVKHLFRLFRIALGPTFLISTYYKLLAGKLKIASGLHLLTVVGFSEVFIQKSSANSLTYCHAMKSGRLGI